MPCEILNELCHLNELTIVDCDDMSFMSLAQVVTKVRELRIDGIGWNDVVTLLDVGLNRLMLLELEISTASCEHVSDDDDDDVDPDYVGSSQIVRWCELILEKCPKLELSNLDVSRASGTM